MRTEAPGERERSRKREEQGVKEGRKKVEGKAGLTCGTFPIMMTTKPWMNTEGRRGKDAESYEYCILLR
jgi:hypothetical protein